MAVFLHVGCGANRKEQTTRAFAGDQWQEVRLDVNPDINPDIVGSMLDMSAVDSGSMDAIFSSHNIEHLYPHEVPLALAEFRRVLRPDGFVVITCPDLQSVCERVAQDILIDPVYESPAGPISPIDILYGHRPQLAAGNLFMAHRCGFTERVLTGTIQSAGFSSVAAIRRQHPYYDLWTLATIPPVSEAGLRQLVQGHFPVYR